MDHPLISIITPTYNVSRFLAATLESILAQSETRWECILVDDGSSDDSVAIAHQFVMRDSRFRSFQQANRGPSAARNHGLRLADPNSEFVTFMDADDVWHPRALEFLLKALREEPEALAANGVAEYMDAEGHIFAPGQRRLQMMARTGLRNNQLYTLEVHQPTTFDALVLGSANFPPGVLLTRKAMVERIGGFDETIKGPEDWDVLIRLSRHGYIRFLDELVLYYRRHDKNFGASSFVPKAARQVMAKTYHSPENTPEQRQVARTMWRLLQRQQRETKAKQIMPLLKQRQFKQAASFCGSIALSKGREFTGPPRA